MFFQTDSCNYRQTKTAKADAHLAWLFLFASIYLSAFSLSYLKFKKEQLFSNNYLDQGWTNFENRR